MPLGTLKDNENFIYFKGEEETDAIAVNCIRSGDGCAEADYRDKSLTTEHGMQLRLNQGDMGIVSLKEKLLLDDMEGIRIAGSGSLHILAAGEVKITGSEVRVAGTGGVLLYEGTAEADREGNIVVAPQGKIELSAEDGERAIHNRGKEVTYYLAWEHEDLSHPSNRYRDAPQQKDYDWMKLGTHVAAGLMIAGGIAALAAGGVLLLGAAAATAIKIGMTVFLAGSLYVGEQALSDIRSGRVSDLDQYTRKAVAGSVVGFLTGASGLLMAEASLWGVLALGFGEGLVGSIVTQKLLNEDGEIDWGVAIEGGMLSLAMAGFMRSVGRSVKGVAGGSEALEGGSRTGIWDMTEGGGVINGREYSQHAMERMAPDTPSVRAELSRRAERIAEQRGYKVGTKEYNDFCVKYVEPRNIPPSVIEDAIASTKAVVGNRPNTFIHETADVKIVINSSGKVVTVIPK